MNNKWIIWLTGLLFLIYGVLFALDPIRMAFWVTGDSPGTASAIIDMRSTYGGMSVAVGLILLMLVRRTSSVSFAFLAVALVLGAMAFTRVVGIILDGEPNGLMYLYLGGEVLGLVLALWAYRKTVEPPRGRR